MVVAQPPDPLAPLVTPDPLATLAPDEPDEPLAPLVPLTPLPGEAVDGFPAGK